MVAVVPPKTGKGPHSTRKYEGSAGVVVSDMRGDDDPSIHPAKVSPREPFPLIASVPASGC